LISSVTVSYWLSVVASYDCVVDQFEIQTPTPTPIVISGVCRFISNSNPASNVVGTIVITRFDGTQRYVLATSNFATGAFSYVFNPSSNEAGTYTIYSYHPALPNQIVRANFTLFGWRLQNSFAQSSGLIGNGQSLLGTIRNIGNTELTGLQWV